MQLTLGSFDQLGRPSIGDLLGIEPIAAAFCFREDAPQIPRDSAGRIRRSEEAKAKALSALAHKLGRAFYHMLHTKEVFDVNRFVRH